MATFRCRTCHQEGEFVYDAEHHACPRCGSSEVQVAIAVDEMPDALVDAVLELARGAEPLDREREED
ncbi:rubredoxin [Bradyrhizobium diazoefficiens]